MNENINLCEILKDCPEGVYFWSPLAGVVIFGGIYSNRINIILSDDTEWYIEADGKMKIVGLTAKSFTSEEIMLYPSKEQRDWSKWKCPKAKFNPKTLKPFDKVLIRFSEIDEWACSIFSHCIETDFGLRFKAAEGISAKYCIPYNDDTKRLVGTKGETPEFYRFWED